MSKHQSQPGCGERSGGRGTGRPNPSRETRLSSVNGDRGYFIFSVQLTTSKIGNHTRLIAAEGPICCLMDDRDDQQQQHGGRIAL